MAEEDFRKMKVGELQKHLKDFLDVGLTRFKKDELIRLCGMIDECQLPQRVDEKAEKLRREIRLEEILSVSPTMILPNPDSPTITWSASFADFPQINLIHIYSYLIERPSKEFTKETVRAYKSLEAYKNVTNGFVDNIFVSKKLLNNWIFVKGLVSASQRAKKYNAWCLMNVEGSIRGCRCECPVGFGESCSHIGALLFYVLIVNEHGLNRELTPTEQACAWSGPTKKVDEPILIADCTSEDKLGPKPSFEGKVKIPKTVEERKQLLDQLAPDCSLAMARTKTPPRKRRRQSPPAITNLPPTPAELASAFLDKTGKSVVDASSFAAIVKNSITIKSASALERATLQQSSVGEWSDQRYGRVTASKAHSVRSFMGPDGGWLERRTPKSALDQICPASKHRRRQRMLKSLKYGIDHEQIAADTYLELYGPDHLNKLKLHVVGLIVPVDDGHIGASIDRIATCTCGQDGCKERWIVEIKCPWILKDKSPSAVDLLQRLIYLKTTVYRNGTFDVTLRESSAYYTQMQMQMAISGIQESELWIWSSESKTSALEPFPVQFDEVFWDQLKAKIDVFYAEYVAPYLLTRDSASADDDDD